MADLAAQFSDKLRFCSPRNEVSGEPWGVFLLGELPPTSFDSRGFDRLKLELFLEIGFLSL